MSKHPFQYHKPNADQVFRIEQVRAECERLYRTLHEHVPQGRERSVAITNLEQVSMWANKGIVMEEEE